MDQRAEKQTGAESSDPSLEQLVELLVYAPIGLLYEYEDVLPILIRRGKSQVQLAQVLGKMAMKQRSGSRPSGGGPSTGDDPVLKALGAVATVAAEALKAVGVAGPVESRRWSPPDPGDTASEDTDPAGPTDTEPATVDRAPAESSTPPAAEPAAADVESKPLPIANYDELTAREVIGLLPDLDAEQRYRVKLHEEAGRNRKTVLGKIDRLDS